MQANSTASEDRDFVLKCSPGDLPALITKNPHWLKYVDNPSVELVEQAMAVAPSSIRFHPNPTNEQQLAAVQAFGLNLRYLKNPTDEMKIAAIEQMAYAIKYIHSPSHEMQLLAIQKIGDAIAYINHPTEEMKDLALACDPNSLAAIDVTTEDQQLSVIRADGSLVRYAQNPTDAVKYAAIENEPNSISYFLEGAPKHYTDNERARREEFNPDWKDDFYSRDEGATEAMKLRAVELDGSVLRFYAKPSKALVSQAFATSPGIVFDDRVNEKISPEVLDEIQPGLFSQIEAIKAVASDRSTRLAMFLEALKPVVEEMDLPMGLE